MSERSGDSKRDRDALDRWITRDDPAYREGDEAIGSPIDFDEIEAPAYVVVREQAWQDFVTFDGNEEVPPEATCSAPDCDNPVGLIFVEPPDNLAGYEWRVCYEVEDGRRICEDCAVAVDEGGLSRDLVWVADA